MGERSGYLHLEVHGNGDCNIFFALSFEIISLKKIQAKFRKRIYTQMMVAWQSRNLMMWKTNVTGYEFCSRWYEPVWFWQIMFVGCRSKAQGKPFFHILLHFGCSGKSNFYPLAQLLITQRGWILNLPKPCLPWKNCNYLPNDIIHKLVRLTYLEKFWLKKCVFSVHDHQYLFLGTHWKVNLPTASDFFRGFFLVLQLILM